MGDNLDRIRLDISAAPTSGIHGLHAKDDLRPWCEFALAEHDFAGDGLGVFHGHEIIVRKRLAPRESLSRSRVNRCCDVVDHPAVGISDLRRRALHNELELRISVPCLSLASNDIDGV